jgi:hypothetical protein
MGFLLAKIVLLLLAAAGCGALLAWAWFRSRYEDVTREYTRWQEEVSDWRRGFEERLAARPEVDLKPLSRQIAQVEAAVDAIEIPLPMPTDLSPVLAAIGEIRIPEPPPPADLAPLLARLASLEEAVRAIHPAQPETPEPAALPEPPAAVEGRLVTAVPVAPIRTDS